MNKYLLILLMTFCGFAIQAQNVKGIMFAQVKYSKNEKDNSFLLSPQQRSNGFYESVNFLEIDNNLVLRCEEGKSNEYGFIEEETVRSIMFIITDLTYEWIDPVRMDGILFKGTAYSKQLGYSLPMVMKLNGQFSSTISIGTNSKVLDEVINYDMDRLFDFGKEKTQNCPPSKSPSDSKANKKVKPKLTK